MVDNEIMGMKENGHRESRGRRTKNGRQEEKLKEGQARDEHLDERRNK